MRNDADAVRVDNGRLTTLRRYTSSAEGIVEEFLDERLGPEAAFALLTSPIGDAAPEAWVVCPSIGQEHGNLRRLEAILARSLTRAGRAVLRIRPDVGPSGAMGVIDLDTRLAEVADAVSLLRRGGRSVVGALGAASGAMVAMLACEDLEVDALVAVEPVRRGRQYVRESLRRQAVTDLMSTDTDGAAEVVSPLGQLEAKGMTSIRGLRLSRAGYDRIAAVDVVEHVRSFHGRSLLVGISPTATASSTIRSLGEHLSSLGGEVSVEVVEDPLPVPLGEYYYENVGVLRRDTRLELDQRVAELTTRWVTTSPSVPVDVS